MRHHGGRFHLIAATVLGLSLAGCTAASPAVTPNVLVEQAAAKTAALKSVTFELVRVGEPVLLDPTSGIRFSTAGGEYQAPDRVSARVKVTAGGAVLPLDMRWLPEGFYSSNPFTGVLEKQPAAPGFNPATLVRSELAGLLRSSLRNLTLVGTEKIGSAEAHHIRAEADGTNLRALTGGVVAPGLHTVDLYIDVATSQLLRLVDAEPSGSPNGWRLELSNFDRPVEIKAP